MKAAVQNPSLLQRIKDIRKSENLTQSALAEKLGVTQSIVSLIESGKSSVSVSFLTKLADHFNVSLDWLVHGNKVYSRYSSSQMVPLVENAAHADYISKHKDKEYLESLRLYKIPGFENGSFRIFEVKGDSMSPTITEGDKLIVSEVDSLKHLVEGKIYVTVLDRDILVKRIFFKSAQANGFGERFILRSDNESYQDMEVKAEKILELWRVDAKITSAFLSQNMSIHNRISDLEENIQKLKSDLMKLQSQKSEASN